MTTIARIAASLCLAASLVPLPVRAADAVTGPPATAQTTSGTIAGTAGDVRSFKGIPYAAPPIGPLRFKPPRPPASWSGTRDALAFGSSCIQAAPPGTSMSEDCLTLNVWTPRPANSDLPVIVYIYGGGFAVGSSSQPVFDGTALARHGVVVVTFNYRLNVFGFLAHPELTVESPQHTSGNYGMLDVVAALRWVKDNARSFGGNPGNVTIMGESAGAGAVSALLTMPQTKGLYVRAIMESAPVFRKQLTLAQAEAAGKTLAGSDSIATLRTLPVLDILKRMPVLDPDTRSDVALTFGPIADGVVLPDEVAVFTAGKQNAVPIIVGNNVNEGSFFTRGIPVKTLDQYMAATQKRFGANADAARALWPATSDADALNAEATIVGDMDINTGVRKMALTMAKRGVPVYRYLFTRARAGKLPGHSEELPYVFDTPNVNGVGQPAPAFDATDAAVSEAMMTAWTNFAKFGNPNTPDTTMMAISPLPALVPIAWPRYVPRDDRFIVFGDTMTTGTNFRGAQLDFLDKTVGR
jgi:carboxylesterase type B